LFDIVQVCVSKDGEQPDDHCKNQKPPSKTVPCNTHHCAYKWQTEDWSNCIGCSNTPRQQIRNVWCGHESRHWEEKPLRVNDDKCSDSDGAKPPIKRLCSSDCVEKCGGKRFARSGRDFADMYKNLNVMVLEREYFVVPVNVDTECSEKEDEKMNLLETKPSNLLTSHPVVMWKPIKLIKNRQHRRRLRKAGKGRIAVDSNPGRKIQEIPVIKQRYQVLSDEAFRRLGDKVSYFTESKCHKV
jgi:hypothetical protein